MYNTVLYKLLLEPTILLCITILVKKNCIIKIVCNYLSDMSSEMREKIRRQFLIFFFP